MGPYKNILSPFTDSSRIFSQFFIFTTGLQHLTGNIKNQANLQDWKHPSHTPSKKTGLFFDEE